jgi:hypothetical protein
LSLQNAAERGGLEARTFETFQDFGLEKHGISERSVNRRRFLETIREVDVVWRWIFEKRSKVVEEVVSF